MIEKKVLEALDPLLNILTYLEMFLIPEDSSEH